MAEYLLEVDELTKEIILLILKNGKLRYTEIIQEMKKDEDIKEGRIYRRLKKLLDLETVKKVQNKHQKVVYGINLGKKSEIMRILKKLPGYTTNQNEEYIRHIYKGKTIKYEYSKKKTRISETKIILEP